MENRRTFFKIFLGNLKMNSKNLKGEYEIREKLTDFRKIGNKMWGEIEENF